MSIQDKIFVNTHYTRSVNLERDVGSRSVIEAYIPTSRALDILDKIVIANEVSLNPRAWSLVGPYGSGKSSFAVFLSHLVGNPADSTTVAAKDKLESVDKELIVKYDKLTQGSKGYCTILLTGSAAPFSQRLLYALLEKSRQLLHGRNKVISELVVLAESETPVASDEIIKVLKKFQDALSKKYTGLMIVVDELGKFLEFEARHNGVNDIFLLQALSEHAVTDHPVKLSIIVMLHQSFEHYAYGFGEALKNEWAKVQGRFENIPFLERSEQILRVVGTAIESKISKSEAKLVRQSTTEVVKALRKVKAIPSVMDETAAIDLFSLCYPLHPVSALLLPMLCQKVAQNERTLFSYLGSRETHGFQESVDNCQKIGDWIYPWEIYEYFVLNQSMALSDHYTHRRWTEVVTAIERLGDAPTDEVRVLKAIGLMNIIGAQGNFKASKDVIDLCIADKMTVQKAIDNLTEKSIIQYRKFSSEYRVWQGSDFDIDANLEVEREKLGRFSLAECLNERHSLLPIVARKYTVQSGALRYFYPIFVDAQTIGQLDKNDKQARIIFYLAEDKDDEIIFHEEFVTIKSELDICVLCLSSNHLREAVSDVLALEGIKRTAQVLNSDPVAEREFKDLYNVTVKKEGSILDSFTSNPQKNIWYWKGKLQSVDTKRSFQEMLSRILRKIYDKSPVFKNELINRNKPSAQANAARNKLALAMFKYEEKADLGILKFPPEKAIYRACLLETKLHVQDDNNLWHFQMPISAKKLDDPCNLYPVWQRIDAFLEGTEKQAKSLIELNQELMASPYGIKEGMLPILYLVVLIANQQELALYEAQVYTPHLSQEQIERFMKRPDNFLVQRFRITGINHSIHKAYSSTLFTDGKQRSILELARPIAKMVLKLPYYTQTTKKDLSSRAQTVRNLFKLSKSPIKLMLEELPKALGINLKKAESDEEELKALSIRLIETLRELQHCLPNLKDQFREALADAFGQEKNILLADLQDVVSGRCRGLEDYTIDRDGLKAFILRAIKPSDDNELWLEDILSFLGQKPVEKWSDGEHDIATYRLAEMMRKLRELERLRVHYQDYAEENDSKFDVYLLRSVKKGATDFDEIVVIDAKRRKAIQSIKDDMHTVLKKAKGDENKMAALAELVDEFLSKRKETPKLSTKKTKNRIKKKG